MPLRRHLAEGREQVQALIQSGEHRPRRQQIDPGRGQLDGQRKAVEPGTQLRDGRGRGLAQPEVRPDSDGPVQEQRHGIVAGKRLECRSGFGQLQRRDGELAPDHPG